MHQIFFFFFFPSIILLSGVFGMSAWKRRRWRWHGGKKISTVVFPSWKQTQNNFFLSVLLFFSTWPKRQDYRFTRARHASFTESREEEKCFQKKKNLKGAPLAAPPVCCCYGSTSAGRKAASSTRTQPSGWRRWNIYIYIHKHVCRGGGRAQTFRGGGA